MDAYAQYKGAFDLMLDWAFSSIRAISHLNISPMLCFISSKASRALIIT